MNNVLNDLSDKALTQGIEANFFEFISLLRRWQKAEVSDNPELLWTITDIPFFLFNSQMRTNLTPEAVEPAIQAAIRRGQSRKVPICWYVGPATQPADLGAHLEEHGFITDEPQIGMAIDLGNLNEKLPVTPDLSIELVEDKEALHRWCQTAIKGFGMPVFVGETFYDVFLCLGLNSSSPVRHYLGYLNGKPVATSTLFPGAGVAGIYDVCTSPEARRLGIGAAMTTRPLQDARQMGYRAGILQASEMGFPVYRKIGFQEYCKIDMYIKDNQVKV